MAKRNHEPDVPDVVLPADSACAVYKDRAGKSLSSGITEGKANFGAITEAARAIIGTATASDEGDA